METVNPEVASKLDQLIENLEQDLDRLRKARKALNIDRGDQRPRRRPRSTTTKAPPRSRTTRRDDALKLIEKNPEGINASQMAKKLGIKPNYLYRVLSELLDEGKVNKDGRAYTPAKP